MNLISGIQQIGIGIPDVVKAKLWYRDIFGMTVQVFDDEAQAKLMTRYTGGIVHSRRAVLSLNMAGGGGMEIWQYTSKEPVMPKFTPSFGSIGIYAVKIKSKNVAASYSEIKSKIGEKNISALQTNSFGKQTFWVRDPWENVFQIVEGHDWFKPKNSNTGGIYGAVIGVSNIDTALKLYQGVFDLKTITDETGVFSDLFEDNKKNTQFRRVVLRKANFGEGAFGKLLGGIEIELVQNLQNSEQIIFEGRHWGDRGFIHLCFDVLNMDALQKKCEKAGFPFTVDSGNTFDMGESGGRFSYCEDPDGTWIEMVETHKVPILKKLNWYLNLKNRNPYKPLPNWMVSMLSISKVK